MKSTLFVSIVYLALCLIMLVKCEDATSDNDLKAEGEKEVIKVSKEKAKREGWLPWEHWYDTEEYENYKVVVRNYYKPLEVGHSFFC